MNVGVGFPHRALFLQKDVPYRLPKGRESLCPKCKSLMGAAEKSFRERRCLYGTYSIFLLTLVIFLRTVLEQGQTCSVLWL